MKIDQKAAILLWIYHIDLWPEFLHLLKPIEKHINLYIGLYAKNDNSQIVNEANKYFSNVSFQYFKDNCGVDVRPFLYQINLLNPLKEPIFFKLHSKKSYLGKSNKKYINWRTILLHSLLGSKTIFLNNCSKLLADEKIGSLCNEQLILKDQEFLNTKKIQELCKIIGIDYDKAPSKNFCGGNIFASKTQLFQKYFVKKDVLDKINSFLLQEKNKVDDQNDGSYSHSLERLFGYINEYDNKTINEGEIPEIRIMNSSAPNGFFHLVITYNKICYIKEDIKIYGELIKHTDSNMLIKWFHLDQITYQNYLQTDIDTYKKCN